MSDDDFLYGKSKNNSYIVFVIVVFGINNRVVNSGLTFQDHCKCHLRITQFAALFLTAIYTTRLSATPSMSCLSARTLSSATTYFSRLNCRFVYIPRFRLGVH